MKNTFYLICKEIFIKFQKCSLTLIEINQLNNYFQENTLICSLPNQAFDLIFEEEDEIQFSVNNLKV